MSRASGNSWKTLPPPQVRGALLLEAVFDEAEYQLLSAAIDLSPIPVSIGM